MEKKKRALLNDFEKSGCVDDLKRVDVIEEQIPLFCEKKLRKNVAIVELEKTICLEVCWRQKSRMWL